MALPAHSFSTRIRETRQEVSRALRVMCALQIWLREVYVDRSGRDEGVTYSLLSFVRVQKPRV